MSLFGGHTLDTAHTAEDLIPGNLDAVDATIAGLITLGVSGQDAGSGMARLCTGEGWTGAAAEGFRAAFHPGAAGRAAAEARLAAARTRVVEAGLAAARVLTDARDALPAEPGMWTRFGEGFVDTVSAFGTQAADFAGGALDTTISMVGTVEKMNPLSAYNVTHPQQYLHRLGEAGHLVVTVAGHPVTTVRSMVDNAEQEWSHDPGRAAGSLVPAVVVGVTTAGVGDAAVAGAEVADAAAGELETMAEAVGQDTITAAGTASGADGVADSSVHATPRSGSWDFGPTGSGDVQAAAEIQDSGTGLAKAEHDLSDIHVHLDPTPAGQNPVTAAAGDAARSETPAHSVSQSTQWGSFGGWDQPASAVSGVDAAAAARIDAAGTGLGQVERDLAGIHVNPQAGSANQVPSYLDPEYKANDLARQAYRDKWRTTEQDRAWLDNVRRGWPRAARMSDQELLAVERYLSPDGALMNSALQAGDHAALAELEPELLNLTSALNKLPNYRGTVSRGLDVKTSDLGDFLLRYEPGTTIREPGFTTTSTQQPFRGNVRIYVNATHGKDISKLMSAPNQVVFPAGEAFKVAAREFDQTTKMWTIYLDDMGR
jgi:hypothetical protein